MTVELELKRLAPEAVAKAVEKAERYRLLNDPEQAESICLDVLAIDPDHQRTLVTLVLALTDQFGNGKATVKQARQHLAKLTDEYQRLYYGGIISERHARAGLARRVPGHFSYGAFREAMDAYEKAAALRPAGDDDPILRWNSCARTIRRERLEPGPDEGEQQLEVTMLRAVTLYRTTIGKKAVMAVSGAMLFGFTITHLLGNLNLYAGPEKMNAYAAWLGSMPSVVWLVRGVLLLAVVAHIVSSLSLGWRNSEARPVPYRKKVDLATSYAAKTMYLSGPILLLFIVYHLLHLTFGVTPGYEFDRANVYDNVVLGFQHWYVSLAYVVGNIVLGVHLFHGVWSMLQSLGIQHPRYDHLRTVAAAAFAFAITAGNLSFPIMVMAGVVRPSYEIGVEEVEIDVPVEAHPPAEPPP